MQNSHFVNSFIACEVTIDTVLFSLYQGDEYQNYGYQSSDSVSANSITNVMMAMEYNVFNQDKFVINDPNLSIYNIPQNSGANYLSIRPKVQSGRNNSPYNIETFVEIKECWEEAWFYTSPEGVTTQESPWEVVCETSFIWISPGTGNGIPSGGTGNSGSGGTSTSSSGNGNTGYSSFLTYLVQQLGLNNTQQNFLNTANGLFINQLYTYLQTTSASNANQLAVAHIDRIINDPQYFSFVLNQAQSYSTTLIWWKDNYFLSNFGGSNFGNWAINYLEANPQVPFTVFQNQFIGIHEGQDEDYDANYWDNPSLTFISQNLPTWNNYNNAYPKNTDAADVYNLVGGTPNALRDGVLTDSDPTNDHDFDNACALRVSRALNYSGVVIPYIQGQTYAGSDGKYYFLGAKKLNIWMRKTFGTNPATSTTPYNAKNYHITSTQAGDHGINLPGLLNGKKGIYSLVSSNPSWASGHAEILYDNATCDNNCHFFDAPIDYIDIWILD